MLTERESHEGIVIVGLFIRVCVYFCIFGKSKRPLVCWARCKALFVEIEVLFLYILNIRCHKSYSHLFAKVNSLVQVFLCLVIKTYTTVITRWYVSLKEPIGLLQLLCLCLCFRIYAGQVEANSGIFNVNSYKCAITL